MSNNLRIIYDNAADRAAVTASSTAGTLVASNLLVETKSRIWRSTGTSATLTVLFPSAEMISCVALAFCNFSSTATIRVRGYEEAADVSAAVDTGAVLACGPAALGLWDWGTQPLGVNSFSYGGSAYGRVWFDDTLVKKLVIDLDDDDNEQGYLDVSRLIAGSHWSPVSNPEYPAPLRPEDSSTQYLNAAGDVLINRGTIRRRVMLNLTLMPPADRQRCLEILLGNGLSRPLFVSLFPDSDDPALEQAYQIWGRLPDLDEISTPSFSRFSAPITIREN